MSESNKNDGNVTNNNSTSSKASKKKERRQKAKNQSESEHGVGGEKEVSNEQTEATSNQNTDAGVSARVEANDLLDDAKLKSLLDEAYKYKSNPNILPSLLRDAAKTPQEAMTKSFKFWSTQPVPKFDEVVEKSEAIEPNKEVSEIRAEPYALPDGFKWETMKLDDPLILAELYTLLNENYVEDDDAMFRFDYQPDFLKWALQPPGWRPGKQVSKHFSLVILMIDKWFIDFFFQIGMWVFVSLNPDC